VPTRCLQAGLLALFASAYHYRTLSRWLPGLAAREN
jgi:hypothetical protein